MTSVVAGLALLLAAQPGFGTTPTRAFAKPVPAESRAAADTTTTAGTPGTTAAATAFDAAMALVTESTGARAFWRAGYTGKGVDIAIIDSGVAQIDGLSSPGKVRLGPDLSFESQDLQTRNLDTNGHGTHLAGIMVGRADASSGNYSTDTRNFLGMAPDARLLSVKVADSHGRSDISQVIAAVNWVVQHKNDDGMNVRVLLLAFSTDSATPWQRDPLIQALEVAWQKGIFVVVSAGNDGWFSKQSGTLGSPATSPNLMVIGATDMLGTVDYRDDVVPAFSSGGTTLRRVDMVAPGAHVVSLESPGSYAAENFAPTGAVGDRMFRASGTSQSAAVVAGAAALVIQQREGIPPDQLKRLLMDTSRPLPRERIEVQGRGELFLANALRVASPLGYTSQSRAWSDGTGSLDAVRGTHRLVHGGVALSGEVDIFGHPYSSAAMASLAATASSWSDGSWNGNQWAANSWSASSWSSGSWSASPWSASSWSSSSWSASSWSASSWSSSSWSSSSWSAFGWR